jgi:YD repeat-containing protein
MGTVRTRTADGTETVVTKFVSGPLAGALRRIEKTTSDGQKQVVRAPVYDARNRLIADVDAKGRKISFTYDAAGRKAAKIVEGGDSTYYSHPEPGVTLAYTKLATGVHLTRTLANGELVRSETVTPLGAVATTLYRPDGTRLRYYDGALVRIDLDPSRYGEGTSVYPAKGPGETARGGNEKERTFMDPGEADAILAKLKAPARLQ